MDRALLVATNTNVILPWFTSSINDIHYVHFVFARRANRQNFVKRLKRQLKHVFPFCCALRALSGTRTHTLQILSLLPLPIGLLGRNENWAPSSVLCLAHSLAFLWSFNITLVSYTGNTQFLFCHSRPLMAGIPRPATLGAPVTSQHFLRCERPQLLSFCSVVGRHYSGSCIRLTSFIRSYIFNTMGYRFTGTFESCPFKQVYVSHDRPYAGRPVGRREEFLQLASHKIPGLLHARIDCWRPYRSELKRLFYFAQTKIFNVFFLAPFFL